MTLTGRTSVTLKSPDCRDRPSNRRCTRMVRQGSCQQSGGNRGAGDEPVHVHHVGLVDTQNSPRCRVREFRRGRNASVGRLALDPRQTEAAARPQDPFGALRRGAIAASPYRVLAWSVAERYRTRSWTGAFQVQDRGRDRSLVQNRTVLARNVIEPPHPLTSAPMQLDPASAGDDREFDRALRPSSFQEFVGQDRITSIAIAAARQRGEPLDHVLFSGPPGLGKTTLST